MGDRHCVAAHEQRARRHRRHVQRANGLGGVQRAEAQQQRERRLVVGDTVMWTETENDSNDSRITV